MVSLEAVRSSNAGLKALGPGLVAVFVGGTSGIGESAAREFVRNTDSPSAYLVGRNKEEASRIQAEFEALNPTSKIQFIQSDISLLKNVDKACKEIQEKEESVNLLFMSPGYLTLAGRTETSEGLDKKLNLNYYSRLRFTQNLMPQLTVAAKAGRLSRQVSVLGANHEGKLNVDDLSLKTGFTMSTCAAHAITMNSLMTSQLAALYTGTTFIHLAPGAVKTNAMSGIGMPKIIEKALLFAFTPIFVPIKESGERNLFAATSAIFKPRGENSEGAAIGADGGKGGGAYLVNWNDETVLGNHKILTPYREQGVGQKVYDHTMEVFEKVCGRGEKW